MKQEVVFREGGPETQDGDKDFGTKKEIDVEKRVKVRAKDCCTIF